MSSHPSQQLHSQSQSQAQPVPTTSSPLIPLSDPSVTPEDSNARFLDAAATIAAAERFNNHNAHANSAIELYSSVAPPITPRVTNTTTTTADTSTRPSTASSTPRLPSSHIQFQTIAPSPPTRTQEAVSTTPRALDESALPIRLSASRLQTEIHPATPLLTDAPNSFSTPSRSSNKPALTLQHKTSPTSLKPISRTPSLKTGSYRESVFGGPSAASSCYPSPVISAMGDVTPLPSPLLANDSPGPWKKLTRRTSRDSTSSSQHPGDCASPTSPDDPMASTPSKRKVYGGLGPSVVPSAPSAGAQPNPKATHTHARNRSISEYIPDSMLIPKRMVTVSGSHVKTERKDAGSGLESHMRREPHLSESRGLTPIEKPPTPPPSESSGRDADSSSSGSSSKRVEYFEAYGMRDRKRRRWRAIRMLGQGTFSRVMLATSQISSSSSDDEEYSHSSAAAAASGLHTPDPITHYDQHRRRTLVAVKVCEHGPRGGASEDRIEMSLKRELEIMKSIHHPSLVHLKAWNIEPTRAILILSYCPGGDLFDVASGHRQLLTPGLLRRIFAELVGATAYLHDQKIVHRDIKLENVLVNLPTAELCSGIDWATYPYSVITLTDLGLSRRVADDEKLETRCGSDDYAAPEVIMGQPYDGRAIDAWSLGVLLYALLESRLPFDPLPGVADPMRMRSRTSHRIARIEWRWVEYGARDGEGEGEHEADLKRFDAVGLRGAMEVTEGLLKRARLRWPLTKVAETEWVAGGINIEGGIRFREEEEGEEVL